MDLELALELGRTLYLVREQREKDLLVRSCTIVQDPGKYLIRERTSEGIPLKSTIGIATELPGRGDAATQRSFPSVWSKPSWFISSVALRGPWSSLLVLKKTCTISASDWAAVCFGFHSRSSREV